MTVPFTVDYSGKVVLVTGAGGGLSRVTALAFGAAGATVLVVDRNEAAANDAAAQIRDAGGSARAYAVDVAQTESVEAAVADAVARFGRIDCAFNGAGVGSPIGGTILDYSDEHWDDVLNVNLRGMFICLRAEIRQMVAQGGGSIVNVASVGGWRATAKSPAYTTSKHGVIGLTRSVALDHAAQKVRVNAICPGFIAGTAMMDAFIEKDPEVRTAHMNTSIPIGRMGTGNDIANTALWLCSDAAAYVTGAMFTVDGGLTTR